MRHQRETYLDLKPFFFLLWTFFWLFFFGLAFCVLFVGVKEKIKEQEQEECWTGTGCALLNKSRKAEHPVSLKVWGVVGSGLNLVFGVFGVFSSHCGVWVARCGVAWCGGGVGVYRSSMLLTLYSIQHNPCALV